MVDEPCAPSYTLPSSEPFVDLPLCSGEARSCYKIAFDQIYNDAKEDKKTCRTQEYEVAELGKPIRMIVGANASINFSLELELCSRGERKVSKTVKTEELVLTPFRLVGSVGGWLGLMLGFSFYGLSENIFDFIHEAWQAQAN